MTERPTDPQMGEVPPQDEAKQKADLMRRVLADMSKHDLALARLHDLLQIEVGSEDGETICARIGEAAEVYGLMFLALTDTDVLADVDDCAAKLVGAAKMTPPDDPESEEPWGSEWSKDELTHLVIRVY